MPNIEIHGFAERAKEVREKVRDALRDLPFANEIVTTTFPTVVQDLNGNETPYLRVVATPDRDLESIIAFLKPLELDIEYLPLGRWIPA
jgi:hypothetical protein